MKQSTLSFLIITILAIISCNKSNEEKAKEAIESYLNENLDDMTTYEPVKFGKLDTILKLDISGTSFAKGNKKYLYHFEMFHSYRLKDGNGRKYITKVYYELNENFAIISSKDFSSVNPGEKLNVLRVPTDKDLEEFMRLVAVDTAAADTADAR